MYHVLNKIRTRDFKVSEVQYLHALGITATMT